MGKITKNGSGGQAQSSSGVNTAARAALAVSEEWKVPVFPCGANKRPLTEHGFKDASADPAQIVAWWQEWPHALIGVPTGGASGLVAVDVDPKGQRWYERRKERLGPHRLHQTRRGRHLLFRPSNNQAIRNSTGAVAPGVDVRGEGGYIIWWPAHGGVALGEVGELPAWLAKKLRRSGGARKLNGANGVAQESDCDWEAERPRVYAALSQLDPDCSHDDWRDIGMALSWATGGSEDGAELFVRWSRGDMHTPVGCEKFESERAVRAKYRSFKNAKDRNVTLATLYQKLKEQKKPVPAGRPQGNGHDTEVKLKGFKASDLTRLEFADLADIQKKHLAPLRSYIGEWCTPGAWLLSGRPKLGKGWFLLQMLLALARGKKFLSAPTRLREGEKILALLSEDNDYRLKKRSDTFGTVPRGVIKPVGRPEFHALAQRYRRHGTFPQWLDAYLAAHSEFKIVIVDTEEVTRLIWQTGALPARGKKATVVDYEQTSEFDTIAHKHRVVIFLVNHTNKARLRSGEVVDIHELVNRTNTALAGPSGSIVMTDMPNTDKLDPKRAQRLLGIRGRDLEEEIMDVIRRRPPPGSGFMREGPYQEIQQTQAEQEILSEIREWLEAGDIGPEDFVTSVELAPHLAMSREALKRAISRLSARARSDAGTLRWNGYRINIRRGRNGGIRLEKIKA